MGGLFRQPKPKPVTQPAPVREDPAVEQARREAVGAGARRVARSRSAQLITGIRGVQDAAQAQRARLFGA